MSIDPNNIASTSPRIRQDADALRYEADAAAKQNSGQALEGNAVRQKAAAATAQARKPLHANSVGTVSADALSSLLAPDPSISPAYGLPAPSVEAMDPARVNNVVARMTKHVPDLATDIGAVLALFVQHEYDSAQMQQQSNTNLLTFAAQEKFAAADEGDKSAGSALTAGLAQAGASIVGGMVSMGYAFSAAKDFQASMVKETNLPESPGYDTDVAETELMEVSSSTSAPSTNKTTATELSTESALNEEAVSGRAGLADGADLKASGQQGASKTSSKSDVEIEEEKLEEAESKKADDARDAKDEERAYAGRRGELKLRLMDAWGGVIQGVGGALHAGFTSAAKREDAEGQRLQARAALDEASAQKEQSWQGMSSETARSALETMRNVSEGQLSAQSEISRNLAG